MLEKYNLLESQKITKIKKQRHDNLKRWLFKFMPILRYIAMQTYHYKKGAIMVRAMDDLIQENADWTIITAC